MRIGDDAAMRHTSLLVGMLSLGLVIGSVPAQRGKDAGAGKVGTRQDPLADYRNASRAGFSEYLERIEGRGRRYTGSLGLGLLIGCGDGSTLEAGDHAEALRAMVDELGRYQWPRGAFYDAAPKGPRCRATEQAIAAFGLLEVAAVTPGDGGARAREVGGTAFEFLMSLRRPDGSWTAEYALDAPGDLETSAWAVMAMATAARADGFEVKREDLQSSCDWLAEQMADAEIETAEDRATLGMVLFAHMLAGVDPRQQEALAARCELLVPSEEWDEERGVWSHAPSFAWISLAGYQFGGDAWRRWTAHHSQVVDAMHDGPELGGTSQGLALRVLGVQAFWRYGPLLRRRR